MDLTRNNPNCFQSEIEVKGHMLEAVENLKYLGSMISNEGSKLEILSRIAQTTAALSRLQIMEGQSKKISNDQELIQSDPISCPQNQKGNN